MNNLLDFDGFLMMLLFILSGGMLVLSGIFHNHDMLFETILSITMYFVCAFSGIIVKIKRDNRIVKNKKSFW